MSWMRKEQLGPYRMKEQEETVFVLYELGGNSNSNDYNKAKRIISNRVRAMFFCNIGCALGMLLLTETSTCILQML